MHRSNPRFTLRVAFACAFAFAASAAFASGGADAAPASGAKSGSAAQAVAVDPFGKYPNPIEITTVRSLPTITQYRPGDDIHNNVWTRELERVFNIKIKYDWVVQSTEYSNKMNLSLASGDLPDFFSVGSADFLKLANAGQLTDLTDVYAQFASKDLKDSMNAFEAGFNSGKVGGKLFGISPQYYDLVSNLDALWIRSDWLAKYKLDPPKSLADLENIAAVFMREEGKTTKNMIGISLNRELYGAVSSVFGIANATARTPGLGSRTRPALSYMVRYSRP